MQAKVLRNYVVAIEGDFKDGRGAFDAKGLKEISLMINSDRAGLRSRFGHPSIFSDGLGRFLGRSRSARMDSVVNAEGTRVPAVRADLHFDASAFNTPNGDLATYVMQLATSDPHAISSSLVIHPREVDRGRTLAPLWFPERLKASDIVEEGAAVDSLLSNASESKLEELMDKVYADLERGEVESKQAAYLLRRFGEEAKILSPVLDAKRLHLQEMVLTVGKLLQ